MHVKVLSEYGYNEALFGLGLSHGVTSGLDYRKQFDPFYTAMNCEEIERSLCEERFDRMEYVAQKLAGKGNGHDKFLRQIVVWLDCQCPRYFWPELDQYKVATVTQSESTMHTIHKKEFTKEDFETDGEQILEHGIIGVAQELNSLRHYFMEMKKRNNVEGQKRAWRQLIQLLPQSYLQRRILTCNYATLRNIIEQRTGHRLSEWATFIDAIKSQCEHPELLP